MTPAFRLSRVATTDRTFRRVGPNWVGKCLICNGPLAFDARTGDGATLEHIRARSRGGTEDLENLAIVHGRCNWEKGVRWDTKKRRGQDEYEAFIAGLLERRRSRWQAEEPSADRGFGLPGQQLPHRRRMASRRALSRSRFQPGVAVIARLQITVGSLHDSQLAACSLAPATLEPGISVTYEKTTTRQVAKNAEDSAGDP